MWTQDVREELRDVANDGSVRRVQEGLVTVDANALAATVRVLRPVKPSWIVLVLRISPGDMGSAVKWGKSSARTFSADARPSASPRLTRSFASSREADTGQAARPPAHCSFWVAPSHPSKRKEAMR
jgi:hypothetical protein